MAVWDEDAVKTATFFAATGARLSAAKVYITWFLFFWQLQFVLEATHNNCKTDPSLSLSVFSSRWSTLRKASSYNADQANGNITCSLYTWEFTKETGEQWERGTPVSLEERERIKGEEIMALGREVYSDKLLCWNKVGNPYSDSCSTATRRCTSKPLFWQSW